MAYKFDLIPPRNKILNTPLLCEDGNLERIFFLEARRAEKHKLKDEEIRESSIPELEGAREVSESKPLNSSTLRESHSRCYARTCIRNVVAID